MKNIIWLLIIIWSVGCGNASHIQSNRFNFTTVKESNLPAEQLKILAALKQQPDIMVHKDRIYRTPQIWKNMEVRGTWQHLVIDADGQWTAASYGRVSEKELPNKVVELNKAQLISAAMSNRRENFRVLSNSKQVLIHGLWGYTPHVLVDVMARDESQVYEATISKKGRLVRLRPKGFELASGLARVYPGNPSQTSLEEIEIKNLAGDGRLSAPWLELQSAINELPYDKNNIFLFQPAEMIFSAVQAYFFAARAMDWYRTQLHLELKKPLSIKVHVGSTPHSNVAFYYNNQVRLGEGDGIQYQGMARDPSIVTHEVSHAYVEMLSGLPFEGEGGSYSEAFADFFTAIQLSNPHMGNYAYKKGPYKRSLENNLRADKDFRKAMYNDSQIISGTFWDFTKVLEHSVVESLAVEFLVRLGPGGQFQDFTGVLKESATAQNLSKSQVQSIQEILEKRGWIKSGEAWQ